MTEPSGPDGGPSQHPEREGPPPATGPRAGLPAGEPAPDPPPPAVGPTPGQPTGVPGGPGLPAGPGAPGGPGALEALGGLGAPPPPPPPPVAGRYGATEAGTGWSPGQVGDGSHQALPGWAPGPGSVPSGGAEPGNVAVEAEEDEDDGAVLVKAARWPLRKPVPLWARARLLVLIAGVWGALFWYSLNDPLVSWRDGLVMTWNSKWWLEVLFAAELLRQANYLLAEHWGTWDHFWVDLVFGQRRVRLSDWGRYRAKRLVAVLAAIALVAVVAGAAQHENPVAGLFSLPGQLVSVLGYVAYIIFIMAAIVLQFVAMYWFLSRGGIEVYFPDDIRTRFSHVWGQDAVLERVKESIVFLEDPGSIESKGGYVPGGILLWGPPGTGKTLMAEAVAGETGKPFVFVDPGAFIQMFVGIGPLKVRGLFRKLRKLAVRYGGVIVFFDEADSLGSRGMLSGGPAGGVFGDRAARAGGSPWAGGACHGGTYVSEDGLNVLLGYQRHTPLGAPTTVPEGRRRVRDGGMMMGGMGGGGGMGTLQALLTEMSGLSKPRGFMNRVVRRGLGMKPKAPPKYRIMIMMATNMPNSLDDALLRPGRIDRIYKVGYPSKSGRVRTYQGYFDKVHHDLTPADIDKLATVTPYATGATMKDLVNESLIVSIRRGHEAITWSDVLEAKRLKDLGLPEDVEYVEQERHAVAVHEACHAVVAYRARKHLEIDLATIEKGGTYLGMVHSIKPEDRFTNWKSEFEADVMVSLASLAGERRFFGGDSSSGVSGDLESATAIASFMEAYWGMGATIASHAGARPVQPAGGQEGGGLLQGDLGKRVEQRLYELLEDTDALLAANEVEVMAVAHALESHKTLSGEDVEAVIEGKPARGVDGRIYKVAAFAEVFGAYHRRLLQAHRDRVKLSVSLPRPADWAPGLAGAAGPSNGHDHAPVRAAGAPDGPGSGGGPGPVVALPEISGGT